MLIVSNNNYLYFIIQLNVNECIYNNEAILLIGIWVQLIKNKSQ